MPPLDEAGWAAAAAGAPPPPPPPPPLHPPVPVALADIVVVGWVGMVVEVCVVGKVTVLVVTIVSPGVGVL